MTAAPLEIKVLEDTLDPQVYPGHQEKRGNPETQGRPELPDTREGLGPMESVDSLETRVFPECQVKQVPPDLSDQQGVTAKEDCQDSRVTEES